MCTAIGFDYVKRQCFLIGCIIYRMRIAATTTLNVVYVSNFNLRQWEPFPFMIEFEPAIKEIASDKVQSAIEFENGPKQDPHQFVATYDANQWEEFIDEWVYSLEGEYVDTQRATGAGDKGIDVAGFCDEDRLAGTWDNYQCKCYQRKPLSFADIAPEIAKILWYSFSGVYNDPRVCHYISPKGASPTLSLLVNHAPNLKAKGI